MVDDGAIVTKVFKSQTQMLEVLFYIGAGKEDITDISKTEMEPLEGSCLIPQSTTDA